MKLYDFEALESLERLRGVYKQYAIERDKALALGILAKFKKRMRDDPEFKAMVAGRWRVPSC